MREMSRTLVALIAVTLSAKAVCAAGSAEVSVTANITMDPSASLFWKTVTDTARTAALDWPEGAVRAVLTVVSSTGESRTIELSDPTVTACALAFTAPASAADERTVDLSITYYGSGDAALRTDTATLGLVQGTGTETTIPVRTADSPKWRKLKSAAVLPIPADATALTVDGDAVSPLDAPGWRYWDPELGLHELTLSTDAGDLPATVERLGGGLLLLFR